MTTELVDTVTDLMSRCDPAGPSFQKLAKILAVLDRGTMVGPGALRFIRGMVTQRDNVECAHLLRAGRCDVPSIRRCGYVSQFSKCTMYMAARGSSKGNPLSEIGGGEHV